MKHAFFEGRLAALAVLGLVSGVSAAGCGAPEGMPSTGVPRLGRSVNGLTATTILPNGSTTVAKITGNVFYWNGEHTSGNEVYRLLIGENFHAVSGCSLAEFNSVLGDPFNQPVEQFPEVAGTDPNGLPYPIRARLSCKDEPGDLPLAKTLFYLDDATLRYYFPSGSAGEYYSFLDSDKCVYSLRSSLFKLDDRISFNSENWLSGKPPDLSTEIAIGCDPDVQTGAYRIYLDQDFSVPNQYDGYYVAVEATDGNLKTYIPVHRVNGDNITEETLGLLQDWLGIPRGTVAPPLTEAPGFQSTDPNVDPVAAIDQWKVNRRFWDLCLGDPLAATPPPCTHQHFLYGTAAPESKSTPDSYGTELLLNGSVIARANDTASGGLTPPFFGCEGTLETAFGLSRSATPTTDSRTWAMTQSQSLLQSPPEARFICPSTGSSRVCSLELGGASGSDRAQTIALRTLNNLFASAYSTCLPQQRTAALEITLNSDLEVNLSPLAWVNFGSFPSVSIKSASGTKVIRFHEMCDNANPCVRVSYRTRPVISISPSDPTRTLTMDHVALQYVADNLASQPDGGTPSGSFFNLNTILLQTIGTSKSRVRVVLTDSSIGVDPVSPSFLSQALAATYADVFLVRTPLRGTSNATIGWKTLAAANSLVVLDGRPTSPEMATLGTALLGASGGARFSDGTNDLLAINALIQGPLVANAISQSTWVDSTLSRSPRVEAVHFTGTEAAGFPSRYAMLWTGNNSRVTNLQSTLKTVPFALFDVGMKAVPRIMMAKTVSYFDVDPNAGGTPLNTTALGQASFCNTNRGSVLLNNGLSERCPR